MDAQQLIQDVYFVMLYGGVTMLGVAAAFYLLFRRANAIAPDVTSPVRLRRWAVAFLLVDSLSRLWWMEGVVHPLAGKPEIAYLILNCLDLVAVIPAMAGTLLAILQDRRRRVWPLWVAMLPALILAVLHLVRADDVFSLPLYIYVYLLTALFVLYMVFAVRQYGRWLRDNYADLEHKEIKVSLLVLTAFLLFLVLYAITEYGRVAAYLMQVDTLVVIGLLLWRVETLQELSESTAPQAGKAEDAQRALPPKTVPTKIGVLLKKHCEDSRLYLQNDLTLAQLANAIGTNRTYLSQHFAQQGITYNAYINGLRIHHFVHLYEKAVADGRKFTAQQLAFESGFHSYSTFIATFKQSMGTTVTAWTHSKEK